MAKEKDPLAIRNENWSYIKVDEYTLALVKEAVTTHKARNLVEAVGCGMCSLLGKEFYTPEERKFMKRMEIQAQLSADIRQHQDAINKIEG